MKQLSLALLAASCVFAASAPALAQNPQDFDTDGTPGLSAAELRVYLLHRESDLFRTYDGKRQGKPFGKPDGVLDDAEMADFLADQQQKIYGEQRYFKKYADGAGNVQLATVNEWAERHPPAAQPRKSPGGFYVRKNVENISTLIDLTDASKAEAALLSYSRDFRTDANLWTVRGTVGYGIPLVECATRYAPPRIGSESPEDKAKREKKLKDCQTADRLSGRGAPQLSSVMLVPSLSIDRFKNSKDRTKDVDALTPRLGAEFEFIGDQVLGFSPNYFRAALLYGTDSKLKSGVGGIELQWETRNESLAINDSTFILDDLIGFRFRPLLIAQATHVFDRGTKANIRDGDSEYRLGGRLGLKVWPTYFPEVSLYANWTYLLGIASNSDNHKLFEAGASWQIGGAGNFSLEANYRKGEAPLVKDDIEAFLVGFGVKF